MATEVAYPKEGVTKLKQDLGYGRPGQKRDNRFSEALRKYIKRYKSRCKIAGKDLCKWEGHKSQLTDMVLDFLEERENGPRWWPDDKTSFNYGPLQFSEHGEK